MVGRSRSAEALGAAEVTAREAKALEVGRRFTSPDTGSHIWTVTRPFVKARHRNFSSSPPVADAWPGDFLTWDCVVN